MAEKDKPTPPPKPQPVSPPRPQQPPRSPEREDLIREHVEPGKPWPR